MKKITLTRPAPYQCEGVTLIPGDNTVTADQLAKLMRNPAVSRDINAGILKIGHGAAEKAEPTPAADGLDALRDIAAGDGRRRDVQEARAKLAEIEGE